LTRYIEDISELESLYGKPGTASLRKVVHKLTPLYRKWIMAARYCVLSTVGPQGTDGSPRGDEGPVVQELDEHTVLMPDWRGNNRMDSLRNIVADGRLSLMFIVSGSNTVVRLNGTGRVTTDAQMTARFEVDGKHPRSVIVIKINEIYSQCARAGYRSRLWARDESGAVPSVGDLLSEATNGEEGGDAYDAAWGERAAKTMW
jgi:PPOX class probable FMN-dependent enzyme